MGYSVYDYPDRYNMPLDYEIQDLGFVYVAINESLPGVLKIGKSTRVPSVRAKELSSTSTPTPFHCIYCVLCEGFSEVETNAHKELSATRVSDNREFFKVSVLEAVKVIKDLTNDRSPNMALYEHEPDLLHMPGNLLLTFGRHCPSHSHFRISDKRLEWIIKHYGLHFYVRLYSYAVVDKTLMMVTSLRGELNDVQPAILQYEIEVSLLEKLKRQFLANDHYEIDRVAIKVDNQLGSYIYNDPEREFEAFSSLFGSNIDNLPSVKQFYKEVSMI